MFIEPRDIPTPKNAISNYKVFMAWPFSSAGLKPSSTQMFEQYDLDFIEGVPGRAVQGSRNCWLNLHCNLSKIGALSKIGIPG
jgi:hypothetical protein